MLNFLDTTINNEYLRAAAYLVITFVALRIVVFILERVILKLTVKTKTDLDDKLIEKLSNPITFLVLLVGLKISILELTLSNSTLDLIQKIFTSFMILIFAVVIYRVFDLTFFRVSKRVAKRARTKHNEGLTHLISGTIKVIFIIGALLYIISSWGIQIGPLLAGIGIGGIAIAFALQSSLSNVFGGVSIILDKSIEVGDLVKLEGGVSGKILRIGLRSTKIKTFDNEIIIVPNSKLADSNIQNIAQPEPKSRVVIPFGVAYGSDIEKVKKIVMKEIKSVAGFTNDPEPVVRFLEMGDSSLNFKAYFFVESYELRFAAIDEANTKIYNALNKAKISIPFPQMDVHVKK